MRCRRFSVGLATATIFRWFVGSSRLLRFYHSAAAKFARFFRGCNRWLAVVQAVTNGTYPDQSFEGGYLPGGVYVVSGALTPITISKIRIYGDGSDVSRIVVNGGSSNFTVLQIGNNVPNG